MNITVRTYDMPCNTYHFIKTAKIPREQKIDRMKRITLLVLQKIAGIALIAACYKVSVFTGEGMAFIVGLLLGLLLILINKPILEWR